MPRRPQSIFGLGPDQVRQQQFADQARLYGSLPLGTAPGVQAGGGFARAIGGALGHQDPQVARAQLLQEAEEATRQQVGTDSPRFLEIATQELARRGLVDEALFAKQKSLELRKLEGELAPENASPLNTLLEQLPKNWAPDLKRAEMLVPSNVQGAEREQALLITAQNLRANQSDQGRTSTTSFLTDEFGNKTETTNEGSRPLDRWAPGGQFDYSKARPATADGSRILDSSLERHGLSPRARVAPQPTAPLNLSGDNFTRGLAPHASSAAQELGTDAATILAVAALETGRGRAVKGNNFFGIKSKKGTGQVFTTHEVINGKRVKIRDNFRAYESPAESFNDFAKLIKRRYPNAVGKRGREFFQAMKAGGYATDPNYVQKLSSIYGSLSSGQQPTAQQPQATGQASQSGPVIDVRPGAFESEPAQEEVIRQVTAGRPVTKIKPPKYNPLPKREDRDKAALHTSIMNNLSDMSRLIEKTGAIYVGGEFNLGPGGVGSASTLDPFSQTLGQDPAALSNFKRIRTQILSDFSRLNQFGTLDTQLERVVTEAIGSIGSMESFSNGAGPIVQNLTKAFTRAIEDVVELGRTAGIDVRVPQMTPDMRFFASLPEVPQELDRRLREEAQGTRVRWFDLLGRIPQVLGDLSVGPEAAAAQAKLLARGEDFRAVHKFSTKAAKQLTQALRRKVTPRRAAMMYGLPFPDEKKFREAMDEQARALRKSASKRLQSRRRKEESKQQRQNILKLFQERDNRGILR